ncbi:hypothetical protein FB451DRAFT_1373180, partial [Mycena latifolia]
MSPRGAAFLRSSDHVLSPSAASLLLWSFAGRCKPCRCVPRHITKVCFAPPAALRLDLSAAVPLPIKFPRTAGPTLALFNHRRFSRKILTLSALTARVDVHTPVLLAALIDSPRPCASASAPPARAQRYPENYGLVRYRSRCANLPRRCDGLGRCLHLRASPSAVGSTRAFQAHRRLVSPFHVRARSLSRRIHLSPCARTGSHSIRAALAWSSIFLSKHVCILIADSGAQTVGPNCWLGGVLGLSHAEGGADG